MNQTVVIIAWIVVGYALLVAAAAGVGARLRAPRRPSWLTQMVVMLEVLAVVLALGGAGWLAQGGEPGSRVTFIGYLATVVILMPAALSTQRADVAPVWHLGVLAIAAVAVAVVAWRIVVVGVS